MRRTDADFELERRAAESSRDFPTARGGEDEIGGDPPARRVDRFICACSKRASAVEAMRRASPFPPIPENLKDLANTPLRMQFTVTIGVRG